MTDFGSPIGSVTGLALEHAPSVDEVVDYNYLYHICIWSSELTKYRVSKLDINSGVEISGFYLNTGEKATTSSKRVHVLKYGKYGFIPSLGAGLGTITRIDFEALARVDAITLSNFTAAQSIISNFQLGDYAYYGVYSGIGTASRIYKVNLATFTEVGYITLPSTGGYYRGPDCFGVNGSGTIAIVGCALGIYHNLDLVGFSITESKYLGGLVNGDSFVNVIVEKSGQFGNFFLIDSSTMGYNMARIVLGDSMRIVKTSTPLWNGDKIICLVDPYTRYAYISVYYGGTYYLLKYDIVNDFQLATLHISDYGNYGPGLRVGNLLYIQTADPTNNITIVDLERMSIDMRLHVSGVQYNNWLTVYD